MIKQQCPKDGTRTQAHFKGCFPGRFLKLPNKTKTLNVESLFEKQGLGCGTLGQVGGVGKHSSPPLTTIAKITTRL